MSNVDAAEIDKFTRAAARWWDPEGDLRTLHDINPLRLEYVRGRATLPGARVLDVGCGGGIFSEALARAGARVTGIDGSAQLVDVARMHAEAEGLAIDYRVSSTEALAEAGPEPFEVVTCMELLEHVPDPGAVVAAMARLLAPGGSLFLSTINRTAPAYAQAVVGAEYVLGLLPRGTHDYERFIRPAELARWLRAAGLELRDLAGMRYNPLTRRARLGRSVAINYLVHALAP